MYYIKFLILVKFFKINSWLSMVELIVSLWISTIIFLIVFMFINRWLSEVDNSINKTNIVDQVFIFNNDVNNYIKSWYNIYNVIWNTQNKILFLKNLENNRWIIIWVINQLTMKLQSDYTYWDNYIWYRLLSEQEVVDVELDQTEIYNMSFHKDKLYNLVMVKDLELNLYNNEEIVDLYFSTFTFNNSELYWKSLTWFYLSQWDLLEFNFNF